MTDVPSIQTSAVAPSGAGTSQATAQATAQADSPRFQQLLEKLQQLADQHKQTPPVEDADQLREAMRSAHDGFVTAMDLRRQLEDAFRRQTP